MDLKDLMENGYYIEMDVRNTEEFFKTLYPFLLKKSYVNESFLDAIEEREGRFPTGIEMEQYNIALPHVDSIHVKQNALILCRLIQPITFRKMDETTKLLQVKVVFLLLIKDLQIHVQAISDLTKIWKNADLMNNLLKVKNKQEVVQLFSKTEN